MHCPKSAPMAKSKASHMILNGLDQSGAEIMDAEMSFILSFYQEFKTLVIKDEGHFLS